MLLLKRLLNILSPNHPLNHSPLFRCAITENQVPSREKDSEKDQMRADAHLKNIETDPRRSG